MSKMKRKNAPAAEPASVVAASRRPWIPWVACAIGIVAMLLLVNRRLLSGEVVGVWDADQLVAGQLTLVGDYARAGRLLSWDPWSAGGSPMYAVPDVGVYSPFMFILYFLAGGTLTSFAVVWLVFWGLGGLGMLLLARHLKAPWWGGALVAIGWLYCGFYTGHAEHQGFLLGFSALPWIIWRLDVALTTRRYWPAVEAGCLWGLSALGGGIPIAIISGCFCAPWAFGRVWLGQDEELPRAAAPAERAPLGRSLLFAFACLAITAVIGVAILGSSFLTFLYEARGYTERANVITRELATTDNALHPGALATFASPIMPIIKLAIGSLWSYTDVSTVSIYCGALIPVFAILAIVNGWRQRWRWWLLGLALFCIAAAMGQTLPLRGWLYDLFPPMRFFRHAGLFRGYFIFSLAVLALYGVRDLHVALSSTGAAALAEARRTGWTFAGIAVALSIVALIASSVVDGILAEVVQQKSASMEAVRSNLKLPLADTLLWLSWGGISVLAILTAAIRTRARLHVLPVALLLLAVIDGFITAEVSSPTMYTTGPTVDIWKRIDREHVTSLDLTPNKLQRSFKGPDWIEATGMLNTKNLPLRVPVLYSYQPMKNRFHEAAIDPTLLGGQKELSKEFVLSALDVPQKPGRIWFSEKACQVNLSDATFLALLARAKALGVPPLAVHTVDALLSVPAIKEPGPSDTQDCAAIAAAPAMKPAPVEVLKYEPELLKFNVTTPKDGWLLVTDRWSRSWSASVNGKSTPIMGGNFIFRAIQVPAGKSEIAFTYTRVGWPWVFIAPWATVFIVLAGTLLSLWRRKQTVSEAGA